MPFLQCLIRSLVLSMKEEMGQRTPRGWTTHAGNIGKDEGILDWAVDGSTCLVGLDNRLAIDRTTSDSDLQVLSRRVSSSLFSRGAGRRLDHHLRLFRCASLDMLQHSMPMAFWPSDGACFAIRFGFTQHTADGISLPMLPTILHETARVAGVNLFRWSVRFSMRQ